MIDRDRVSGLKYLIIAGTILAFMVLVPSSETFAQLSTFSGSGGYGYPGSFYGGYSRYGYPGYVSWSGPFAYSRDSSQWVPLFQYSSGSGPGIPNPFNPIYGLVPPGYGPLLASTYSPPVSHSWPPIGMAYNPPSGSYYIPGSYYTQPTQYYGGLPSQYRSSAWESIGYFPGIGYRTYLSPQYYTTDYINADVKLTGDNDGDSITLKKGKTLSITLQTTESAAMSYSYEWELDSDDLDTDIIKKVAEYLPSKSFGPLHKEWVFEAKNVGTTTIKIDNTSIENDIWIPPFGNTFEIEVTVKD